MNNNVWISIITPTTSIYSFKIKSWGGPFIQGSRDRRMTRRFALLLVHHLLYFVLSMFLLLINGRKSLLLGTNQGHADCSFHGLLINFLQGFSYLNKSLEFFTSAIHQVWFANPKVQLYVLIIFLFLFARRCQCSS